MERRNWKESGSCGAARWGALLLLLVLFIPIAGLMALPVLINSAAVTGWVLQEIEQRTGYRITTESAHVRFRGGPTVEVLKPEIRHGSSPDPFFSADRLEVALQVWPLLEGRFVGTHLVLDRPKVTIRRELSGAWRIGTKPSEDSAAPRRTPLAFLDTARRVLVTGGIVTVVDDSARWFRKAVRIEVSQATIDEDVPGRSASIQMAGEVPQERDRAGFAFSGTLVQSVRDAELPEAAPLLQVDGDLRVYRLDLRHLVSAWTPLEPVSDGLLGSVQGTAHVRLTPRAGGYDLTADDWRADLSDLSFRGMVGITGLGTAGPRLAATVSAAPVTITRLVSQTPAAWIPAEVRTDLLHRAVDGLVTLQSLTVAGPLEAGAPMTITGSAAVRNGRFQLDPRAPVVEDLTATLLYDAQQVRIVGLRARCGPVRVAGHDLLITQWLTTPSFDVRLTGRAPLAGVLEAAGRLEMPAALRDALVQVRQAHGELEIVAHAVGGAAGVGRTPILDLELTAEDAGFEGPWLPMPLDRVRAKVKASSTVLTLEQLDGRMGPVSLTIGGTVTRTAAATLSDIRLSAAVPGAELLPLFGVEELGRVRPAVAGFARLEAVVTGSLEQPRLKGIVDLTPVDVVVPRFVTKAREVPATIAFDIRMSEADTVNLRRLELKLASLRLMGDGAITLSKKMPFAANVRSKTLSVKELPKGLSVGPVTAGTLKGALHLEGNLRDRSSYHAFGQVTLDDGVVISERLKTPLREVFLTLRFDRDRIEVPRWAFRAGDSDVRITGVIDHWTQAPAARLLVESSQINIEQLEPLAEDSREADNGALRPAGWWSNGKLDATVFVDHIYHGRMFVTGLSCRIGWDRGVLTVDRISGDTDDGHVAGRVVMQEDGRRSAHVRTEFRVSGVPVERSLALVADRPILSGWLTTTGKFQGQFVRAAPQIKTLASRRPIQLIVEDGRIYDVPVITKLLSLMNLPALLQGEIDLAERGLPFHKLKLVFAMDHGNLAVKQFLLDSPVLKLSGTGRYDVVADEFDLVVAASPLGSYSRLLKTVPLFGTLFAGDRQGFDTAIFSVKGKAKDPDVRYLPAESFVTGIKGTAQLAFDILVNAISLPKEAFELTEEMIGGNGEES